MFHKIFSQKAILLGLVVLFSVPLLSGCELTHNYLKHDRENNMEPQDYRDALAPRQAEVDGVKDGRMAAGIPPLQPYVAQPNSNYRPMPLVSISVNQSVPLRDVLYEIAEQAEYDVELDPRIRGSIIFSARNRPLDMVIERISDIAGLRYTFEDDMMRVELDTPYHEIYKVNYLALTRTNTSSITNDISVVSGEGTDTGSTFSAENESTIDFWGELETNLTQIVEANRDSNRLATTRDPQITVAENNPAPVMPLSMDEDGNIVEPGPNVSVQAPEAILNVNTLAEEEEQANSDEDPFEARFSINRQAGLVSVFAPKRLQDKISDYMGELKKSVTAQVLIEAKVLEVSLNDRFSAGIDWTQVNIDLFGGAGAIGFGSAPGSLIRGIIDPSGNQVFDSAVTFQRAGFQGAASALSRFGTVQALASPRLSVLNNQSAALNVAENVVFFEIDVETTAVEGAVSTTFDTNAQTVPEGVLINVQPSIDLDNQTISMTIRPTVTSITSFTNDPNPSLATAGVVSPVPNVNVQEFDSVISMNNGQAVVLGGLIQDKMESERNGVPVLSEAPVFGGLFRNQKDEISKTELVVFLRATIIEGDNTIHSTDKDLYRGFSSDRRPFKL